MNLLNECLLALFMTGILNSCLTPATSNSTSCIGSGLGSIEKTRPAVYLHGLVGEKGESQKSQELLAKVSTQSNLRLAMPRGYKPCSSNAPKDQYCWQWGPESHSILQERWVDIQKQSQKCFADSQKAHLYIGFSNGAGFLNRLYQDCSFEENDIIISIGNGLNAYSKPSFSGSMKNCGKLYLLIGKNDAANLQQAQHAYKVLLGKGADVSLTEFEGGHELNEALLLDIILDSQPSS